MKTSYFYIVLFRKSHTGAEFDVLKKDFTLIIKDGVICVLDGKGNVWIELKDESIKKEELKCLLVTTGWGGQGIWRISKKNCRANTENNCREKSEVDEQIGKIEGEYTGVKSDVNIISAHT